eukprot:PhM_4_TR17642/c0_g1_i1/m.91239
MNTCCTLFLFAPHRLPHVVFLTLDLVVERGVLLLDILQLCVRRRHLALLSPTTLFLRAHAALVLSNRPRERVSLHRAVVLRLRAGLLKPRQLLALCLLAARRFVALVLQLGECVRHGLEDGQHRRDELRGSSGDVAAEDGPEVLALDVEVVIHVEARLAEHGEARAVALLHLAAAVGCVKPREGVAGARLRGGARRVQVAIVLLHQVRPRRLLFELDVAAVGLLLRLHGPHEVAQRGDVDFEELRGEDLVRGLDLRHAAVHEFGAEGTFIVLDLQSGLREDNRGVGDNALGGDRREGCILIGNKPRAVGVLLGNDVAALIKVAGLAVEEGVRVLSEALGQCNVLVGLRRHEEVTGHRLAGLGRNALSILVLLVLDARARRAGKVGLETGECHELGVERVVAEALLLALDLGAVGRTLLGESAEGVSGLVGVEHQRLNVLELSGEDNVTSGLLTLHEFDDRAGDGRVPLRDLRRLAKTGLDQCRTCSPLGVLNGMALLRLVADTGDDRGLAVFYKPECVLCIRLHLCAQERALKVLFVGDALAVGLLDAVQLAALTGTVFVQVRGIAAPGFLLDAQAAEGDRRLVLHELAHLHEISGEARVHLGDVRVAFNEGDVEIA